MNVANHRTRLRKLNTTNTTTRWYDFALGVLLGASLVMTLDAMTRVKEIVYLFP